MMSSVTCPTCQHKQLLPESEMGKLQSCPHCQTSFVAGKSTAEKRGGLPAASMLQQQPSYAKTMMADAGAQPIKYNCPRCKASLEAPANEGGTKKNCPHCSQRHQVPAAPALTAAAPALNKTMLTGDESSAPPSLPPIKFNCPNCKKPLEALANEAGTKKNCTHCSQRLQVPAAAASSLNKTKLASSDENGAWPTPGASSAAGTHGGMGQPDSKGAGTIALTPRNVAIGVGILVLLFLLALVVPAVLRGGNRTDAEAMAKAQIELEKLKAEIELKKHEMERQKTAESGERQKFEELRKEMRDKEERMRAEQLSLLRSITDQNKKTEMEQRFNEAQRKFEDEKRELERKQQQALAEERRKADENQRALNAAQQKQQTIIHQPPPVVYYPPYHYRYYWPW